MQSTILRKYSLLCALAFTLLTLLQGLYCFERPFSTLDSLVYVSLLNGANQEVFRDAGKICAASLPGPHNGCNVAAPPYLEVSQYSPADYATFIRFYTVKPFYLWVAQAIRSVFHVDAFVALRAISALSYIILAATILMWLWQHLAPPLACFMAFLICNLAPVLSLGKDLLPDGFSDALMFLALFAILYLTHKLWLQLVLLAILPLARPDNILFCLLFGALLIYRTQYPLKARIVRIALLFVGGVIFNSILQRTGHALPYVVLFNHSFLTWTPPSTYPSLHLSASDYICTVMVNGFKTIALDFPLPLLFTVLALSSPRGWRPLRDLIVISVVTSFTRLVLFPNMEDRYYTWYVLVAAIGAAVAAGDRLQCPGPFSEHIQPQMKRGALAELQSLREAAQAGL